MQIFQKYLKVEGKEFEYLQAIPSLRTLPGIEQVANGLDGQTRAASGAQNIGSGINPQFNQALEEARNFYFVADKHLDALSTTTIQSRHISRRHY